MLAGTLTLDDVAYCSGQFYSSHDKVAQDAALLSYLDISKPKRVHVQNDARKQFTRCINQVLPTS